MRILAYLKNMWKLAETHFSSLELGTQRLTLTVTFIGRLRVAKFLQIDLWENNRTSMSATYFEVLNAYCSHFLI